MRPMHLRPVKPLGSFHARTTCDGEARSRDGQTYVVVNDLGLDSTGQPALEILFEDGMWMLVRQEDLEPFSQVGQ